MGFRAGGPEQIALPGYSEFVPWGDVQCLEERLRYWLTRKDLNRIDIANAAEKVYSIRAMLKTFVSVYGSIL